MSGESGESAWHEVLRARLQSTGRSDESIIDFIEIEVPDEGNVLDYKQDLYISADPAHHDNKRQANLMKHFSALANVRTQARFRYLLIGFDNDGDFTGMQYREQMGGDQVLDVDDADLRNVFADKVSPSPKFEVYELEQDGDRGGVIVIHQGEQIPLVIENTLTAQDDSPFVYEGQTYTRDGSRTARMDSDDFASMMQYREELITEKIQELTAGLSQVVGIPDDQLANIDLNVTQSDEGVPVRDLVTTEAPATIDEELKTAVKGSKGSGGHEYERRGIYEFLAQRDDINLDENGDEKIEFLVRASLRKHLHGAYWLTQYEGNIDVLIETIIAEDIDGRTISPLERTLLVLNKREYLQEIDREFGAEFNSSNADDYADKCHRADHDRVSTYVGDRIRIADTSYDVRQLVYRNEDATAEELMDDVVEGLLDEDDSTGRGRLRQIELIYLAANT